MLMPSNKELLKQELFKVEEALKQTKSNADQQRAMLKENQDVVGQIQVRLEDIRSEIKEAEEAKKALDQKIMLLRKDEQDQKKAMDLSQAESRTCAQALGPLHLQEKSLQAKLESIESRLNQLLQQEPAPQTQFIHTPPSQPAVVVAKVEQVQPQAQPQVQVQPQAQPQAQPQVQPQVQPQEPVRAPRVDAKLDIDFDIDLGSKEDAHTFYTGFTKNISEGGLFISTSQYLEIGHKLTIQMGIPPNKEKTTLECEVRWVRRDDNHDLNGFYGVGVQFINLSPEIKSQINQFIKNKETLFYED